MIYEELLFEPLARIDDVDVDAVEVATPGDDEDERGFVIVWMLLIIGVLIAVAALSVDLVHAYSVAQRMQNAADAAASAGAVDIPTDTSGLRAQAKVCDILHDHYGVECSAGEVPIKDKASSLSPPGPSNEMRVKITKRIDTFFARFIGFPSLDVSREAHAQYDAPVQMGSPANFIGGVPECPAVTMPGPAAGPSCMNSAAAQNVWAQVQGIGTQKGSGNALTATNCNPGPFDNCIGGVNKDYQPDGEYFQVRAENAGTLDIWVYDPAFVHTRPDCLNPAPLHLADTGPNRIENNWIGAHVHDRAYCSGDVVLPGGGPMTTTFTALAPDPSVPDGDPTNNPAAVCNSGPGTETFPGFDGGPDAAFTYDQGPSIPKTYFHKWFKLCSVNVSQPTTEGNEYLVRVGSASGVGTNGFSIMGILNGSPTNAGVFARKRMPIYTTNYTSGGSADFFLARVLPSNQDRTLVIDFFDLGDASAGSLLGDLDIYTDGVQNGNFTCSWTPPPNDSDPPRATPLSDSLFTGSGCSLRYNGGPGQTWNGRWISLKITIPDSNDVTNGYRCDTSSYSNCWIKLKSTPDFTAGPAGQSDATTWAAHMLGSPVRLVK
jgi:hypothetical protein